MRLALWAWPALYANLPLDSVGVALEQAGGAVLAAEPWGAGRSGPLTPCSRSWSALVLVFVLGSVRGHARLRMEVEDSGGVVLTAYHSHARSQPQGAEPRCASRASHPLSRYRAAPRAARASGGAGRGPRLGERLWS